MDRLVAFGCSYTYGHGLPDCIMAKGRAGKKPSKFAWPHLLAKKLDKELYNAGVPGASNKLIMDTVINFPFKPTDTVVILWTYLSRHCILSHKKLEPGSKLDNEVSVLPNGNLHTFIGTYDPRSLMSARYYRLLHNEEDQLIMTNHYISYVRLYLEKHNIPNLQTTIKKLDHPLIYDNNWNDLTENYPLTSDNHLGIEAQEELANRIHKRMTKG